VIRTSMCLALALLCSACGGGSSGDTAGFASGDASPWKSEEWNPASREADLVLPMPCGGSMAFRKVVTRTEDNWLSDVAIRMGAPDSGEQYADYVWDAAIAGSLSTSASSAQRFYYIGQYEVSNRQWASLMKSECRGGEGADALLPAANVNWFDAVEFLQRYNTWLLTNKFDAMTAIDPDGAFVRLPTEAEWEFAARGGEAVQDEETRRGRMFPMDGALETYVQHYGAASCNGKVQPIGGLKPNPLGLFDVVGNVSELTQDAFRLNAGGRLHGEAGGYVARGGSCQTPAELVATSLREEQHIVDLKRKSLLRPEFSGMRLVISGATLSSERRINELREDFEALGELSPADAAEKTQRILDAIKDEKTKQLVLDLKTEYDRELTHRAQVEARAARSMLTSGAILVRDYRQDINEMRRLLPNCEINDPSQPRYQNYCQQAQDFRAASEMTRTLYGDLLFRLADDVPQKVLMGQRDLAKASVRGSSRGAEFVDLLLCQVIDYKRNPRSDIGIYFEQMLALSKAPCDPSSAK